MLWEWKYRSILEAGLQGMDNQTDFLKYGFIEWNHTGFIPLPQNEPNGPKVYRASNFMFIEGRAGGEQ